LNDLINDHLGPFLADIVYDHITAQRAEKKRVGTTKSSASTSNDNGLTIESNRWR
jgi:hypothetical protein